MHCGIVMFPTDYAIRPDDLGREAAERGFESLWVPEHTHIPASRASPWPGGADLPKEYWHTYDPFVALAMAAAVTTKLKIGTGICLIIERDPSRPPRRSRASTTSRKAGSCSGSAAAGTPRRWRTTGRTSRPASRCCASASSR